MIWRLLLDWLDYSDMKTSVERLHEFAEWAVSEGYASSIFDFSLKCGLSQKYIYNMVRISNGDVGAGALQKIHNVFPMLNVEWVVLGTGEMIRPALDYEQAYNEIRLLSKQIASVVRRIERLEKGA